MSPVQLSGSSLDFHRESLTLLLHGPVLATQETERLPRVLIANGEPPVPIKGTRELHASLLTVD
jgi:hypothetical protein